MEDKVDYTAFHPHTHTHIHSHTVYCACLLAAHVLPIELNTESNPQFYINVADIDQLKTVGNYIACKLERIY